MQTKLNQSRPYGQAEPTLPGKAGEGQHEYFVSLVENLLLYDYALTRRAYRNHTKSELFQRLGMSNHSMQPEEAQAILAEHGIPQAAFDHFYERSWRKFSDVLSDALRNLSSKGLLRHFWGEDGESVKIFYYPDCLKQAPHDKWELEILIDEARRSLNSGLIDFLNEQAERNYEAIRDYERWGDRILMDDLFDMIGNLCDTVDEDDEPECMGNSCEHYYGECDGTICLQDDCDFDDY